MEDLTPNTQIEQQQDAMPQQENSLEANEQVAAILEAETEQDEPLQESIEELTRKFEAMTREEIADYFGQMCRDCDFEQLKHQAGVLKSVFTAKTSQMRNDALAKFVEEGGEAEDFKAPTDETDEQFRALYGEYKEKRQRYLEQQEKEKAENLVKKQAVLAELRALLQSEGSLKEIHDSFNAIQEKWKAIGAVPRTEINSLWENYRFLIEQFFDKVKLSRELRDMGLKKNLEEKIALCERVEGLVLLDSINDAFKQLQECHRLWKEIGPVPSDKSDEVWERFRTASDAVNKRRVDYYEGIKETQASNLLAKIALCEKLEELLKNECETIRQWNERTAQVNELFDLWKSIGSVRKSENEKVWMRFKKPVDDFFMRKKIALDKFKSEQSANFQKKEELCVKAEAIAEREDWKKATEELIALQKEWKTIGYDTQQQSENLWQRFRAACDRVFERKSENYKKQKENQAENIAKKEAIIQEVKDFSFGEDKQQNLEAIKEFQRRWSEIGFVVPAERQRLWNEFRAAIDAHFDKLQSDSIKANLDSFKMQLDASGQEVGKGGLAREKKNLQERVQKLQSDLRIWENNLGFLANSKQADLLKAEFEKKMSKAKADISLMKAKIALIDKQESEKNDKNIEK